MASMKEVVIEKAEKMAAFLKDAEDFPVVKAFRAEQAAATLAKRQEAAEKIKTLRKEQGEVVPLLLADRDAKEAKYKEAKAAMDTAVRDYQTAKAATSSKSYSFDIAIGQQEQILFESADPTIDAAIQFFRDKLDWLRESERISHVPCGGERNILTERVKLTVESNIDAIKSALQYCMAAVKELERMKLTPVLDVEKIERMKTSIPDINVYTEYTSEKPTPGSVVMPPIIPRFGGAADDEYEKTLLNRLHKKAADLLKKK